VNVQVRLLQLLVLGGAYGFFVALSLSFPFFPPPHLVLQTGFEFFLTGEIYAHVGITLYETVVGHGIAILGGIAIGVLLGGSRTAGEVFEPIILSAYAVPKIVLLPVLLMIFGVGLTTKIANATIHGIFPVILNTVVGVREVNRILIKAARSMRASRWQIFRKVYFPSMVLPVFAGIRIGLGFAFLGSLLAELFEAKVGLGFLVTHYYNTAQISKMLAVILFVFVLIVAINAGMKAIETHLSRWRGTWTT
jgi:ABC-type nitrate/sulfonate/bicarbonate transport system permease component